MSSGTRFQNNPWDSPNPRPLWPTGVRARVCRPCGTYAGNEGYCSSCGHETTETVVYNTPEPEGANDTLGMRRRRIYPAREYR